jgi:asparagine synthase (glutamine-hydrolysing)
MCGIAGFIDPSRHGVLAEAQLQRMLDRIAHRGPDAGGSWSDVPVVIGHRRLAIIDLSPAGNQPMVSRSGRFVIAFNGEIYNHASLRKELLAEGAAFVGHSDTEVLLALIERLGLKDALKRCIGMFAIALWDRSARALQLARDRLGEKPLYYGWHRGAFLWGSELRALAAHAAFEPIIDGSAVAMALRYGYVPGPRSIFSGTCKLPAGSILSLKLPADPAVPPGPQSCSMETEIYWSALQVAQRGVDNPFRGSAADAADVLEALLVDAVGLQMQADVPLGAFLSGGLDSSTVVALMQKQSTQPVKTYSIGFEDDGLDEAPFARAVAKRLGTDHRELYVTVREALAVIPRLPAIYDEPLGDASQIPTVLVAQMAKAQVTVGLSGDGGDELFAGYPRYALGRRLSALPFKPAARAALCVAAGLASAAAPAAPSRISNLCLRLARRRHWLQAPDDASLAERLCYVNPIPDDLHRGLAGSGSCWSTEGPRGADFPQLAMHRDRLSYLPDDLLVKIDRAFMSVSLEGRCPFLDHRVVEFAASLPAAILMGRGGQKLPLREVLYRHVPRALVDRPKAGFNVPIARWLRNDLSEAMRDAISDPALHHDLGINRERLAALFGSHLAGRADWSALLWTVFTMWQWNRARRA